MGFHHGAGNGGLPLQGTDSKNSQPPLIGNVAQIVGEIALPLPAKARCLIAADPSSARFFLPGFFQQITARRLQRPVRVQVVVEG